MPKILIIEDEPGIADTVVYALKTEGFETLHALTGTQGLEEWQHQSPDLIVLDVGLPDTNGFELCKTIRQQSDVPIIFLTARSDEIDRVVGLEIGGDDYIVKPFSPRELTARVKARLRRHTPAGPAASSIASDGFHLDEDGHCAHLNTRNLNLSRYEFRIFSILYQHPGRIYSRDQLMEQAWDEPDTAFDRTIDTHIKTLRQKIRRIDPKADPIKTHRGLGYAFEA